MARIPRALVPLLAALLGLAACNPMAEVSAAQSVAAQTFSIRQHAPARQAISLYLETAAPGTSHDEWVRFLDAAEAKLGRPTAYELAGWNVNVGTSAVGTGTLVSLGYKVRYEHAEGTESIVLFKPSGGAEYRVVGHHVNSPALLDDRDRAPRPATAAAASASPL